MPNSMPSPPLDGRRSLPREGPGNDLGGALQRRRVRRSIGEVPDPDAGVLDLDHRRPIERPTHAVSLEALAKEWRLPVVEQKIGAAPQSIETTDQAIEAPRPHQVV